MNNLTKYIIFFLVSLSLIGCSRFKDAQTPHDSKSSDVEYKSISLVGFGVEGFVSYCSGVWVAKDAFLTANHCVKDEDGRIIYTIRNDISAVDADEVESLRFGDVVSHWEDADLALVRTKLSPEHGIAFLASIRPFVGEQVQTMGNPLGLWFSYSTGTVAAIRKTDPDSTWFIQSTAPISPGNSGGGLFDMNGDLIGICNGYFPHGENLNLYVHLEYIRKFLSDNKDYLK